MSYTMILYLLAALGLIFILRKLQLRLQLSRAKHRSLTGHARMSRRLASLVPFYEYDEEPFLSRGRRSAGSGGQPARGLHAPLGHFRGAFRGHRGPDRRAGRCDFRSAVHIPLPRAVSVQPFRAATLQDRQPARVLRRPTVTDLDGNRFFDLTGSYGTNLFGYDFYKECIRRGSERVQDLGPVLGSYHPVIAYNVRRLREISGLDEVSFHMSGTEAVMQAVRLAQYHTRRRRIVRFSGAYHGWWGDVQPGAGNPVPARDTLTLKEMGEGTLRVLRARRDIACVLVNPLQALHPNSAAPGDSSLVDSGRGAHFDRAAYTKWLQELRTVCSERRIVLIFDEVFVGFRLAPGGAQEYFGVRADMVTYGKTLGGGLPVGAICGRQDLMRRYREDRPADICFARGTFNSHPYVMGAMCEFLERLDSQAVRALYQGVDELWNRRAQALNERLRAAQLPVQVANIGSIWTVSYSQPSRYNWMFQYYLRAAGLALSWVGTGRLIFSLNYTEADFAAVAERFVAAATAMRQDAWWWSRDGLTNKSIRRQVLKELLQTRWNGMPWGRSARLAADRTAPCNTDTRHGTGP